MEEINFLQGASTDESRVQEMWAEIEQEKIQKEREKVRYDQWLQEREEKKIEIERQWRPNYGLNKSPTVIKPQKSVEAEPEQQAGTSSTPSPLLTSLLKTQNTAARSAPTITNLLTGTPSPSISSPTIITLSSTSTQLIHPITHPASSSSVQIPVSQSAPTLVTLLDKKPEEKQPLMMAETSGGKDGSSDGKDEEAELLADFNELIAGSEKFDDEDLMEDINAIIMNPEILEDKIVEPIKDVDDSSQATSTDDYDKLKIKQLVEDFAGVPEVEEAPMPVVEEPEVIQVPSDIETSNPASVEMVEPPVEKEEEPVVPQQDDKVMVISDESNDGKKEEEVKVEEENSKGSEEEVKDVKEVFQVDDSDEDVLFEDAKEHHDDSAKSEKEVEEKKEPEKEEKVEEKTDSDDEVLEAKVTRTSRKKAAEPVKPEAPSKSRDHSENDDKTDAMPIRTRSRHSSVISSEPKSTFNFPKEQDHSMWKARWDDCVKDLQKLGNFSSIVDNKLFADDSYKSVILCPMNMKMIQKNIENHVSTLPGDVKRDFALMCTNIIMLNKKGPKFNENVHQFIKDGMEIIDDKLEVEDAYKSYRKQIKKKP